VPGQFVHARKFGPLVLLFLPSLLFLFSLFASCSQDDSAKEERPNVILISIDTCREDRVSVFGGPERNSPGLAEWAREFSVWTNCLTQSTSTGPSHKSIFTGQYVQRHGMYSNFAVHGKRSLALTLKNAGYRTAAFTAGGWLNPEFGFGQGFDTYRVSTREIPGPGGHHIGSFSETIPRGKDWIGRESGKPFFLFLHGYDVHCPYWPPEPWRSRFAGWFSKDLQMESRCGPKDFGPLFENDLLDAEGIRYLNDLYDGGVAYTDHLISGFLADLRDQGLLDRSIVVILADHGDSLGEHQWVGHTLMWEEQIKVPLMIRFPGGRWAGVRSDPVQLVDLLPTLLDFLGLPEQPGVQGISLLPFLEGEKPPAANRMRLCKFGGWEAVRFDDRFKLVFRKEKDAVVDLSLYDLQADPGESHNLAATEPGRTQAAKLLRRYQDWRRATQDEDRRFRGKRMERDLPGPLIQNLQELGYTTDSQD